MLPKPVVSKGQLVFRLSLALLFFLPSCGSERSYPEGGPADYIFTGGQVWTGDDAGPWAEAIAVRDERIVAVGTAEEVADFEGPLTEVRELSGKYLGPGFIDNHTHFDNAGALLLGVNLLRVTDAESLEEEVRAAVGRLPQGAWMVGGSWGAYEQWAENSTGGDNQDARFDPDRSIVDPVSPNNPGLLNNWDRSMYLANGAALEAAGADCSWSEVECESGAPTGRVGAAAAARIRGAIPPKSMEQKLAEARVALAQLAELGVTTFLDITPPGQVAVYEALRERGELTARVSMRIVLDSWDELQHAGITEGFGDDWVRYQGLKAFVDGIMGNSQARFYEPYLTTGVRGEWRNRTNTGHVTGNGSGMEPPGNMEMLVKAADAAGFSPRVHAIGDEAIDTTLAIYENVIRENPARDRRFAIIHTQVIRGPETARRMAELGIIAEAQPYHTIDDMRWMEERIGERARWAYAFKTLHDAGVILSFGSDWPGTNASWYTANPLQGMYAAVARQTLDGQPAGGWFPQERIDPETALRAYTVNNAWAEGTEDRKGALKPGFLADLVVLDRNPLEIDPSEMKDVRVLTTMVGGRIVFEGDANPEGGS